MAKLNSISFEQVIREVYDSTTNSIRINIVSEDSGTTNAKSSLDFQQCWILAYDATNKALKVTRKI